MKLINQSFDRCAHIELWQTDDEQYVLKSGPEMKMENEPRFWENVAYFFPSMKESHVFNREPAMVSIDEDAMREQFALVASPMDY